MLSPGVNRGRGLCMITDAEVFFASGCGRCARFATPDCSAFKWRRGLKALREICRGAGLEETVKWAHPCYIHAGRDIALVNAFRGDFRINFMNAALLRDAAGVLERRGPNTRHPDMIRFVSDAQVIEMEAIIRAYLAEAKGYAEDGVRPPESRTGLVLPDELIEAMDGDPELAEAFHGLTPGRQRSYVLGLASARKSATRLARIARFRPRILAGKGATER